MNARMTMLLTAVFGTVLVAGADERKLPANLDVDSAKVSFSAGLRQTGMPRGTDFSALVEESSVLGEDATFGFSEKSPEAKFFVMGALYSEALAMLRGTDLPGGAERLQKIEHQLIQFGAPSSLFNFVTRSRQHAVSGRYRPEVLVDYLELLQPFLEDYASRQSEDMVVLFRMGAWLTNMSLTAAAGNTALLRQPLTINHAIEEMQRMDAPKGVQDALSEIGRITSQEEITDRDTRKVVQLVKRMQMILG